MDGDSTDRLLGIVGGTGPESTIDYYRSLVETWRRRRPDGSYPRVVINSIEAGRVFRWLGEEDFDAVGRDVGAALAELAAAGCGRALLASNAVHLAFEHIDPAPAIPLIHIVDTVRDAAEAAGLGRLGLIGTSFIMEASLYPDRFALVGLDIVVPDPEERALVHDLYMDELVAGVIREESQVRVIELIRRMKERDEIQGLILGGTELALILTEPSYEGLAILNTVQLHVEAAVDWLLAE